MNLGSVLLGILPLLVFVLVDFFLGKEKALVAAMVLALGEGALSFYLFGELDGVSAFSIGLVILMALVSLKSQKTIYFKMQPVILSAVIGGFFLYSSFTHKPLLNLLMNKYRHQMPQQMAQKLALPLFQELMTLTTPYLGSALLIHALVTAYTAFKLSNWWWLAARGVGFYFFIFLAMVLAQLHLRTLIQ